MRGLILLSLCLGVCHAAFSTPAKLEGQIVFEKFRTALEDSNSSFTLDDAVELLPDKMLGNPILLESSTSMQSASGTYEEFLVNQKTPLRPRVILATPDAAFALAFTSKHAVRGGHTIETIVFSDEKKQYNFYQFDFKKKAAGDKNWIAENPTSCRGCHGGNLRRPNWSPYNDWPNTYGRSGHAMAHERADVECKPTAFWCWHGKHYSAFMEAKSEPRYAALKKLSTYTRGDGFSPGELGLLDMMNKAFFGTLWTSYHYDSLVEEIKTRSGENFRKTALDTAKIICNGYRDKEKEKTFLLGPLDTLKLNAFNMSIRPTKTLKAGSPYYRWRWAKHGQDHGLAYDNGDFVASEAIFMKKLFASFPEYSDLEKLYRPLKVENYGEHHREIVDAMNARFAYGNVRKICTEIESWKEEL